MHDPHPAAPYSGAELRPLARLLAVLAAWGLLLLAQPGLFGRDGQGWLAWFALIPWAWAASRPGKRAKTIEWIGASFGLCGYAFWMRYLLPWAVYPMGMVPALYMVAGGVLLRFLVRRWPLALAVPLAWLAAESVRFTLEAPFSFGWWRVGSLVHAEPWYAAGARVFGVWGLSFGMAAFAGWVVDRLNGGIRGRSWALSWMVGLGAPALVWAAGAATAPPATTAGPRVLVLTAGLEQSLKQSSSDPMLTRVVDPIELAFEGTGALQQRGESPPDLVALGETMLPAVSADPDVAQALAQGTNAPDFAGRPWQAEDLQDQSLWLNQILGWLQGAERPPIPLGQKYPHAWLHSERPPLPAGTPVFAGVEGLVVRDGHLWRVNGARIWDGAGQPGPLASKVHLVPAAENPYPAAYLPFLLNIIRRVGGYIPDFVTLGGPGALEFTGRDGRDWRAGVLICYDNAFDDPFLGVQGGAGVDFHMVASNEAWYERSVLMDHMIAFSRLAAISVGRSVLRVTNSGATCLVGPDGTLLDLLEVEGEHKMVRGTLLAEVPVPVVVEGGERPRTPFVRTRSAQTWGFWLVLALAGFLARRR
ncbi:MAG: nitrilase-related carbon-nitrogen hydrolase [Planctomycetota bacterium]